jgi:hypothetical protein
VSPDVDLAVVVAQVYFPEPKQLMPPLAALGVERRVAPLPRR